MTIADIGYGKQFEGWYDRIFQDDASARVAVEALAGFHPDPASGTLEFGVGTGRIALPLSHRVGPVTGVDSSREMLAALEKKADEGEVTAELGDIRTYRGERQYGLVYCVCSTLAQILDPEGQREAVARAAELLRPGGRLLVETHNRPGIVAQHEGLTRTTMFVPYPEPNTGIQMHATLLMDNRVWQVSTVWFEADGTHRIGTEAVRLLTPDEVDGYARDAGLLPEGHYSDWQQTAYSPAAGLFVASYTKSA
ncbi:class I SAM-dependent methyltransferase [Streptomyces netropsis]|uniref:SAM-dependent methyltransferase n=1 Tax=Streptomyces netropsis TaxID=55404 RepID=A0A7W7L7K7_STRNE|nr:class I SAM-dependent methyltransferase [Streptomyces netropsis]MBB4884471.1 SAM-dependent methyltransferase [Streptomyces netropsis]GGR03465.1 methyltransferase [Streptomyces netropsis]